MNKTKGGRSGQVWSLDYILGLTLFLVTLLLVINILSRTTLVDDGFDDLWRQTEQLSERLMSAGYPSSWRPSDAIAIGLTTDNLLSARKVGWLANLSKEEYGESKGLLSIKDEYAVVFRDRLGALVPFGSHCLLGEGNEEKMVENELLPIAYYSRATGTNDLEPSLTLLNATRFADDELASLLANITDFSIVVLEEPNLGSVKSPYDGEKAAMLEAFVAQGGILFLVGNVNLSDAFSLNITGINTTGENASGQPSNDTFLQLDAFTINGLSLGDKAIVETGQDRYEPLSRLDDGRDFAAWFTHGDGDVLFLGSLNGWLNETGTTLLSHVEDRLNATAYEPRAACINVTLPLAEARHFITVKRLVAHDQEILWMEVSMWMR